MVRVQQIAEAQSYQNSGWSTLPLFWRVLLCFAGLLVSLFSSGYCCWRCYRCRKKQDINNGIALYNSTINIRGPIFLNNIQVQDSTGGHPVEHQEEEQDEDEQEDEAQIEDEEEDKAQIEDEEEDKAQIEDEEEDEEEAGKKDDEEWYGNPHKETALTCCDEVDPVARFIGAVNTIIKRQRGGNLIGYNTDYIGAISAIEDGIRGENDAASSPLAGKVFVVIGAGGASKALAYGAKEKGAKVVITTRKYDRAKKLANSVGGDALSLADLDSFHPEEGMVLANATPVGMHPNAHKTPVPKEVLKYYTVVFDLIYTPKVTRLLREAEECGATVVSGFEMFIRQAKGQFELTTGLPVSEELMRDIIMRNEEQFGF